jgi:hypothetical protein
VAIRVRHEEHNESVSRDINAPKKQARLVEIEKSQAEGSASIREMWQPTNLCATYNHPAFKQLRMNSNEFHSWFHSRKPSMDDVGNPTSVNAR